MKVISGLLRGRIIKGYDIDGTRPTMDRVKEAIFSMIQNNVKESICLDLFAGSGNLGIEAISNGAKMCYFVDNNKLAINTIRENLTKFKVLEYSKLIYGDYLKELDCFCKQGIKFDLIFLDPPFKLKVIGQILNEISEKSLLYNTGQVVVEYLCDDLNDNYGNLRLIKSKIYGDKTVKIYQYNVD